MHRRNGLILLHILGILNSILTNHPLYCWGELLNSLRWSEESSSLFSRIITLIYLPIYEVCTNSTYTAQNQTQISFLWAKLPAHQICKKKNRCPLNREIYIAQGWKLLGISIPPRRHTISVISENSFSLDRNHLVWLLYIPLCSNPVRIVLFVLMSIKYSPISIPDFEIRINRNWIKMAHFKKLYQIS